MPPALCLSSFTEVDHVAVVRVGGARVHLLATDVRKDHLAVPRPVLDELFHFGERGGSALRVSIVEGETHAEDTMAAEAPAAVTPEPRRVVVAASVKKEIAIAILVRRSWRDNTNVCAGGTNLNVDLPTGSTLAVRIF